MSRCEEMVIQMVGIEVREGTIDISINRGLVGV